MRLEVNDAALDHLGEAGFDPVYGARPLKRAIRTQLENPLAQEILAGKFGPGDIIEVGLEDAALTFTQVVEGGSVGRTSVRPSHTGIPRRGRRTAGGCFLCLGPVPTRRYPPSLGSPRHSPWRTNAR
jgi:hypothetical protein